MRTRVQDSRSGVAMLTVLGIIFALCLLMGTVLVASSQRTFMAKKLGDRTRALVIAEAGATKAYTVLSTNFALRTDPSAFPETAFGGGTYSVKITPVGSSMALISSTGVCGVAQDSVVLNVKNYPLGSGGTGGSSIPGWPASPYGFAIVSGGSMTWVGNIDLATSNGWMHANSALSGNGQQRIRGNLSSSVSIDFPYVDGTGMAPVVSGDIGTTVIASVPLVTIPNIDLTPYYNRALTNGQVFTGTKSLSGTATPPGGVMWVNGDINVSDGSYTGSFIATGSILIQGGNASARFEKVEKYPVLVSRDGGINVQGGDNSLFAFHGLVYCKTGGFNKQGNGEVQGIGTIMAAGNVDKNGGWSGMLYEDSTPIPPGGGGGSSGTGGSSGDVLGVTAWQK